MFPNLAPFGTSSSTLFNNCAKCVWHQVLRHKGKGSPGQSQGKRRVGRDFRLKVVVGTVVRERQVVATQRDLNYHPGLNAGIDPRNNYIYAVCDGTLVISTEKVSPDLSHPIAEKFYMHRKGQNIHKRFINIIPPKQEMVFRLVDLI